MIVHRKSVVKVTGDNDAAEVYGDWSYGKVIANLIGNGVEDLRWQPLFDRALLVEKGDLAQHRISGGGLRRTIDNPDVVAKIARDLGQHTCVGCNSGPLFKREIETIQNDAMRHYGSGVSDAGCVLPKLIGIRRTNQGCSKDLRKRSIRIKYSPQVVGRYCATHRRISAAGPLPS